MKKNYVVLLVGFLFIFLSSFQMCINTLAIEMDKTFSVVPDSENFTPGERVKLNISNETSSVIEISIGSVEGVSLIENHEKSNNYQRNSNNELIISLDEKESVSLEFDTIAEVKDDISFSLKNTRTNEEINLKLKNRLTIISDSGTSQLEKNEIEWNEVKPSKNLIIDDGATWQTEYQKANIHGHFKRDVIDPVTGETHHLEYGYGFESSNSEQVRINDWRSLLNTRAGINDEKLNMNRPNFYLMDNGRLITSLQQQPGLKDYNLIDTYPLVVSVNGSSSRLDGKKNNETRIPALYVGEYQGRPALKSVTDCSVKLGVNKYVDVRVTTEIIPISINTVQYRYFVTNTTSDSLSFVATKADRFQMNNLDRNVPIFSRGDGTGVYTLTRDTQPLHRLDYSFSTNDPDDYFLDNYGPDNWTPHFNSSYPDLDTTGAGIVTEYFNGDLNASGVENDPIVYSEDEQFPPIFDNMNPTVLAMKWNEVTIGPGETTAFAYNVGLKSGGVYPQNIVLKKTYENLTTTDSKNHSLDKIEYTISATNDEETNRKGFTNLTIKDTLPKELEKPDKIIADYGNKEIPLDVDKVYDEKNHEVTYNFGKNHFVINDSVYKLKIQTRIKSDIENITITNKSSATAYTGRKFDQEIKGNAEVSFDVAEVLVANVITKFVDNNGNEIADKKIEKIKYGESYKTKAIDIEGYILNESKLPDNAEGIANEPEIIVTYVYDEGTVAIKDVPNVNFGEKTLTYMNKRFRLDAKNGLDSNLIVKDTSSGKIKWTLYVQQTSTFKDKQTGAEIPSYIELNEEPLINPVMISNYEINNEGQEDLTNLLLNAEDESNTSQGLIFPYNAEAIEDIGGYTATLNWNLSIVPSSKVGGV